MRINPSTIVNKLQARIGDQIVFRERSANRCEKIGEYGTHYIYNLEACKVPKREGECYELVFAKKHFYTP